MKQKYLLIFILIFSTSIIFAQPPAEGGTEFDATFSEYITIPNSNNINTTTVSNRTIETYFKVDNATSRQIIYEEGGGTNAIVFYVESGYLFAGAFINNGGAGESIFFREPISNNQWYHVALVIDNSTEFKFYLDGTLLDTRSDAFTIPNHSGGINLARSNSNLRYPNCGTWTTGGDSEYCLDNVTGKINANYYFTGHIWGFRIWDVVRTQVEIDSNKDILITDTSTSPGSDLLAYQEFDAITYLASNDSYQSTSAVLNTQDFDLLDKMTKVYVSDDRLVVQNQSLENIKNIILFSVDGKMIADKKVNEKIDLTVLSSGVYFVKVNFESGIVINKKVVK